MSILMKNACKRINLLNIPWGGRKIPRLIMRLSFHVQLPTHIIHKQNLPSTAYMSPASHFSVRRMYKQSLGKVLGWMDDLRFYVFFNIFSVISGLWPDDDERLCAMKPRLHLRKFGFERGSNSVPQDQ